VSEEVKEQIDDYESYIQHLFKEHTGKDLDPWANELMDELKAKTEQVMTDGPPASEHDTLDVFVMMLATMLIETKADVKILEAKLKAAGILDEGLRHNTRVSKTGFVVRGVTTGRFTTKRAPDPDPGTAFVPFGDVLVGGRFVYQRIGCEKISVNRYREDGDPMRRYVLPDDTKVLVRVVTKRDPNCTCSETHKEVESFGPRMIKGVCPVHDGVDDA
jgi:hypothetical protein